VIVAARRTAITRAVKGAFAATRADDLVVAAIRAALDDAPGLDATTLDDIAVGTWLHEGAQGGNLARRAAVLLGFDAVPGTTVNRACASSLQALRMAAHAIRAREGHAFVVAGVESISGYDDPRGGGTTPEAQRHPEFRRSGTRYSGQVMHRHPITGWSDPRDLGLPPDVHLAMGLTAENVARLRGATRTDQDAFAFASQQRASAAIAAGAFEREIVPMPLADGTVVDTDEGPRPGTTPEALAALPPAFVEGGTVTAGNCCAFNDGAAALIVMSQQRAAELGLTGLARVVSTGVSALSPEIMGLGPVEASRRALENAGMTTADLDLVEINEAFAAQVLPCLDDLNLDHDRVNVRGGAIALGHPYGMGGARLVTTLLSTMRDTGAGSGLVTLCAAGGQGMAVVLARD
jgi:acetyl-CoA C-acetyltransferase